MSARRPKGGVPFAWVAFATQPREAQPALPGAGDIADALGHFLFDGVEVRLTEQSGHMEFTHQFVDKSGKEMEFAPLGCNIFLV